MFLTTTPSGLTRVGESLGLEQLFQPGRSWAPIQGAWKLPYLSFSYPHAAPGHRCSFPSWNTHTFTRSSHQHPVRTAFLSGPCLPGSLRVLKVAAWPATCVMLGRCTRSAPSSCWPRRNCPGAVMLLLGSHHLEGSSWEPSCLLLPGTLAS